MKEDKLLAPKMLVWTVRKNVSVNERWLRSLNVSLEEGSEEFFFAPWRLGMRFHAKGKKKQRAVDYILCSLFTNTMLSIFIVMIIPL